LSSPNEIRAALAAGDFRRAALLFERHGAALCAALRAGRVDAAAIEEARSLLAEALAARAHLQNRLENLRAHTYVAGAYSAATR
jgi:hypothetical protein